MRQPICIVSAGLVFVLALSLTPAVAQAAPKIGVFDSQRITMETKEGQRIQTQLGAIRDRKQQDLTNKEQVVTEMQQNLNQQALSLSTERRTQMELDIQRRLIELNTAKEMATRELQLEVSAAEAGFNEKLGAVLDQFAREEQFSIILEAGAVVWWAPEADVSTAVIDRFNQMFPATEE